MDGRDHPILLRPGDQRNIVERGLDRPKSRFCEPHAFFSDFFEVLLAQAGFQDHGSCVNTHSTGPVLFVALQRRYRERLDSFTVRGPPGDVHLRCSYGCGDTAMDVTVKETHRFLARGIVAERVVNLRIDKSWNGGGAIRVNHDIATPGVLSR